MANKTISDLRELSTVSDNNVLVVETNAETFKVTKENLLKEVNTQLDSKANANHTHDGYATKDELSIKSDVSHIHSYNDLTNKPTIPSLDGYATEAFVNQKISEISNGSSGSTGSTENTVSIFKGLKATFYGDSLTEVNQWYTKGYHSWISDILGLESYENFGVSGFTINDVAKKVAGTDATGDIIFVMAGVNDQSYSNELGTLDDNSQNETIYGSLKLLCSNLKEKYPTKLIVYITPHYQVKYPSSLGITSYEVSKAVKEVCYLYGIPVYDNFQLSGIYPQNEINKKLYTADGCHWNNLGHEKVGKNIAKYMINTFGYIYASTPTTPSISIVLSASTLSVNEGGSSSFTVRLAQQPSENKIVQLSVNNSDVTLDKAQLTFTSSNWNVAQTVNVTVAEDDTDYNNESCLISLNGSGLKSAVVNVAIIDNDERPNIPCTSISLDLNSLSFTNTTSQSLKATLTPSNTTDTLTWSVEPAGIASVVNGVVTPISNGDCVITATCGSQTTTCSVNVNVESSTSSSYVGKTYTITSTKNNSKFFHITALINKPDFDLTGKTLTGTLTASNLSNITTSGFNSISIFTDDTGEVSNSGFKGEFANASVADNITDTTATYTVSSTFSKDATYPYLKVIFMGGNSDLPASFKIDSLTISIDNQEQQVLKLGSFFSAEKVTVS